MIGDKIKELRKARHMTLEELAIASGTSRQTIQRYESGVIKRIPTGRIELLASALGTTPSALLGWEEDRLDLSVADNLLQIKVSKYPLLGRIACGQPTFAETDLDSFAAADTNTACDFCLRAKGDSMMGARIFDGDIVFIRSQASVENGEIAAVIIGDEATLKRVYYYPEEQKLILSPENTRYAPLVYVGEELSSIRILGKAVAFQSAVR